MEPVKRGRKPLYHTNEERLAARRITQRKYYERTKITRKDINNLKALNRYYRRKVADKPTEKYQRRLREVEEQLRTAR